MLSDSILASAGWLFFAIYSAVVATVCIAAFGGDVLSAKARAEASQKAGSWAGRSRPLSDKSSGRPCR